MGGFLNFKLELYTLLLKFFLRRKNFNKVGFFNEKKKKLAIKIRKKFS